MRGLITLDLLGKIVLAFAFAMNIRRRAVQAAAKGRHFKELDGYYLESQPIELLHQCPFARFHANSVGIERKGVEGQVGTAKAVRMGLG